ncbi:MAG TPA: glycosyltransferase family 2 protein [Actinomycetes bacterium]|jgi:N-acetylglucosaminyltransferase|nr:glycosyltransferase family 2 protein [Actinomycetes bacterium]
MPLLSTAGFRTAFFLYIQVLLIHSLLQHRYASQHRRRHRSAPVQDPTEPPAVDVWLPCYNEDPALLAACCASLDAQDYTGRLHVFLVDDGSSNRDELEPVYERYRRLALDRDRQPRWTVIERPRHEGKRRAQEAARRRGGAALVLTIDSDTEIAPDGISRMVAAFGDPAVGAIVGRIGVHNASSNRLTSTIEQLYWLLFEQERAAQARFHAVLCCAGPFSLYRRAALERCWDGYLNQIVCGKPCNSGDDLHLTSLILADGYLALYQPDAVANTQVPATVRHFLRQQVRWWRSFYRELGQIRSAVRDRHWFLAFDVVARGLPPPLLAGAVLLAGAEGLLTGLGAGLRDLALVVALVLTHGSFASGRAADLRFFRAGVVEALLVPFQFYALLTCTRSDWGRREPRRQVEHARLGSRTR